ncbi:MAG: DUF3188 domain-containing protein [Cyanobacteriota bacterium]|nr:DUF3188 domain-containing protein [Cyanobacteriota bacterium]
MPRRPWLQTWLTLVSPLLILLSLVVLLQRRGSERMVAVPSLLIGAGLLISNALHQGWRRRRLLEALRESGDHDPDTQP